MTVVKQLIVNADVETDTAYAAHNIYRYSINQKDYHDQGLEVKSNTRDT